MARTRQDESVIAASEMGLAAQKIVLRFFLGQYLQKLGGDFTTMDLKRD